MRWAGLTTALVTPFTEDAAIDEEGLATLVQRQIDAKADGVLVLGTTGEAPTLSLDEREKVIRIAQEICDGQVPLMVGTGSYSTEDSVSLTRHAMQHGADAALVVTPYYNKPTQAGMLAHFSRIADAVDLPLMLYHHPGRCGCWLEAETVLRLAEIDTIIGLKEASGDLQFLQDVLEGRPESFSVLAGDDMNALTMMLLGADGLMSVVGNLLPESMKKLVDACADSKLKEARKLHYAMRRVFAASAIETNPIPIKALMKLAKLPAGSCRLPLKGPTEETWKLLKGLMNYESESTH